MNTNLQSLRESRKSLVSALADTEQTIADARSAQAWHILGHAILVKGQVERELSRINNLIRQEEDKERAALKRAQAAAAMAARQAMQIATARKRAESEARLKAMRERQALIERMMSVLSDAQSVVKEVQVTTPVARKKPAKKRAEFHTSRLFAHAGLQA